MGRDAKAKAGRRIKLEKADFFELVAALRLHEVVRLEAQQKAARLAAEMVAKEIEASGKKGKSLLDALATKYEFDATTLWRFDEATCELIPQESHPTSS